MANQAIDITETCKNNVLGHVILSEAKDLLEAGRHGGQILRYAQNDRNCSIEPSGGRASADLAHEDAINA